MIERAESVLGDVEVSFFSSRSKTAHQEKLVRGWDEKLQALHQDLRRLTKEGESWIAVDKTREVLKRWRDCATLHGAGVDANRAAYGAHVVAPTPVEDYVPGACTPGRAEHAMLSALQAYKKNGGDSAPRLGICAIGGSGKTTACAGIAACDSVREKFTRGVAWVQLSSTSSAETLLDAVVALMYCFRGADAAQQLLQLPAGHDVVGVAAGYRELVPQSEAAEWLVVIDDVLGSQRDMFKQLLRVVPLATPVLFTTRSEYVVFSTRKAKLIPIDFLPDLDARLLLARALGRETSLEGASPFTVDEEDAWVRMVVSKTQRHALSLSIVGAMMEARGPAWRFVVRLLEKQWLAEELALTVSEGGADMRRSVRAVMKSSLDLLPDAISRSAFEMIGVLPNNVHVGLHVLERLWR